MEREMVLDRLPVDFCHASTLLPLGKELLCCYFGGSREGAADVGIYLSRRGPQCWSSPQLLVNGGEANWNPVLCAYGGQLLLFYKEGQEIAQWRTYVLRSQDGGHSWSTPQELVPGDTSGGRGPVRNKCLVLSDGSLVAGGSVEQGLWTAFVDRSEDGRTWQQSPPIGIRGLVYEQGQKTAASTIAVSQQSFYGRGVIQPSLWESSPGWVHMLLRSSEGFVYRSDSTDGGRSWCDAYATDLPNNNSGLDLVKGEDGNLYLVCNPVAANWGMRSPLSLFRSRDNGQSWQRLLDLETSPGEFSYPAIVAVGGELFISYTWQRKNIAYVHINLIEFK